MTATEPRLAPSPADAAVLVPTPSADGRRPARVGALVDDRRARVALGVAVGIGAALRFSARAPLWLDEAQTVAIARLGPRSMMAALQQDGAPPLYYVVLGAWMRVFGQGAWAARALSGVLGVLALPLAAACARRLGGRTVAALAVVLLATSPFAIRYSTEARMYSLVVVLVLLGHLVLARAREHPSKGRLTALAGVSGALLLTHYWTIYLLAAVGAVLLVEARRGRPPARRLAVAVAAGGLAFVPWLPAFWFQTRHTGAPWAWRPSLADMIEALRGYAGGDGSAGWVLWLLLLGLVALGLFGRALGRGRIELRWPGRTAARPLGLVTAITLVLALIAGLLGAGPVTARYTAVVFPLVVLLAALGLGVLAPRGRTIALAVAAVLGLVLGADTAMSPRTQVPQVARALRDQARPGDVVVYCPDQLGPSTTRLLPAIEQVTYPDFGAPDRVNWVDYQDRLEAARPFRFALDLERRAPGAAIWLVSAPNYVTVGATCARLQQVMEALWPYHRQVVSASGRYFEQAALERFRP